MGQCLAGNTGRLQAVEGFLVAIVQAFAQFSSGVKGQATFREDWEVPQLNWPVKFTLS